MNIKPLRKLYLRKFSDAIRNLKGRLPYVSRKNRKMTLPTFCLPAIITCIGCTARCSGECYGRKAERAYPGVLPCRMRNYALSMRPDFVPNMIGIIRKRGKDWFRIHEVGDFYNQAYLDKWCAICAALPDVRFLAFTKSYGLDFSRVPSNLQIVWSVWPDTDQTTVPPGPRAFAGECMPRVGVQWLECPGGCDNCMLCWNLGSLNRDVHFEIH